MLGASIKEDMEEQPLKKEKRRFVLLTRLKQNKVAYLSLWFLVVVHAVVFIGPVLWPISPDELTDAGALAGWTLQHPFGTDDLGRDVFARMLHGGRVTLLVGLCAMLFSLIIGTIIGACAGFFGKVVEAVLMRITEAMMGDSELFLRPCGSYGAWDDAVHGRARHRPDRLGGNCPCRLRRNVEVEGIRVC